MPAAARADSVLRTFGLAPGAPDRRRAAGVLAALVALYSMGFVVFYPSAITNDDEARYIRQARLMLRGTLTASWIEPLSGETIEKRPAEYPVGSAALMAPFVWLFGEPGAWVPAFLCFVAGVVFTALWLAADGRSPLWALAVLGFPPALVLGRVAMSDTPSLACVALGLWLFWRGLDRGAGWWLAAGFVAGASTVVRETNALPFVSFFAGALLRREWRCGWLVLGGVAGLGVRLVSHAIAFGSPFFARGAGPKGFGLHAVADNWLLHPVALLVFVPGGLLFALAYRGRRRPELIVGVGFFVVFYFFHWFGTPASGFAKRLVVELRYFAPLTPILAFAMAESAPRLFCRLVEAAPPARRGLLSGLAAAVLALWVVGVGGACMGVHFALSRWGASQGEIRAEIARHTAGAVLVTNWWATKKFIRELDREYLPLNRKRVTVDDAASLVERYGEFYVALLDRSDSDYWRRDMEENAEFIASLSPEPALTLDRRLTPTDRLRIWRVTRVDRDDGRPPEAGGR